MKKLLPAKNAIAVKKEEWINSMKTIVLIAIGLLNISILPSDTAGDKIKVNSYEICVICRDNLKNGAMTAKGKCSPLHIFHDKCIQEWLSSDIGNYKCPMCHEFFDKENIPAYSSREGRELVMSAILGNF